MKGVWRAVALTMAGAAVLAGCGGSSGDETDPTAQPVGEFPWSRSFVAVSLRDGDGEAPIAEPRGVRISIGGAKDPGIGWQARCNSFGASMRVTPTRLRLRGIGGTLIGCEEDVEEEDEWLADFFQADPSWSFERRRLTLTADDRVVELRERAK